MDKNSRNKNLKQYMLGGLVWGVFMFFSMSAYFVIVEKKEINVEFIVRNFVWWVVLSGGIYGVGNFYLAKLFKKK
jgi:hypothetical protein